MADDTFSPREPIDDAIALLEGDHAEVAELFERYESLAEEDAPAHDRQSLAEEICTLLTVHAAIEEELFYPAARDALDDDALVDEALSEHESIEEMVAEIQAGDPNEPRYDTAVRVLGELVAHHVGEEERELFPRVRASALDLEELGGQLAARQEMLLSADADADID